MAQTGKNLPAKEETQVRSLCGEDPLEKGMATHSSILAWRIPWTEKPATDFSLQQDTEDEKELPQTEYLFQAKFYTHLTTPLPHNILYGIIIPIFQMQEIELVKDCPTCQRTPSEKVGELWSKTELIIQKTSWFSKNTL